MKRWLLYALLLLSLLATALWASSPSATAQQEPDLPEFEPTERVPAGSSVAFPVDI